MASSQENVVSPPPEDRTTGLPSAGQLWQAPVFLLGLATLLGLWFFQPWAGDDPQGQIDRDLEAARHVLGQSDGDLEAAAALARRAVEASRAFPERTGEALLVLGLSHLRMAEQTLQDPEGSGDEEDSPEEDLGQASEQFEKAQRLGVPEGQHGTLQYALAKTVYYQGKDPKRAAALLEEAADLAEDRAESFGLLTRAYLRLKPPDLNKALEANRKQRQVRLADETVLAPARLLGGELLLRLGEAAEARRTLELVGEQAPPEVRAQARLLRARSYQQEGLFREAADLYEQALADGSKVPLPSPARAYYDLGTCYRRLGEKDRARSHWEECLRISRGGQEVAPAALELALLYQETKDPGKALTALEKALGEVRKPSAWDNPLADRARAREVFEAVARGFQEGQTFEESVRLAELYQRIAEPGRASTLEGEAATAWARHYRDEARKAADEQARGQAEARARERFLQAARAFTGAAEALSGPQQTEALWRGIQAFFACGDADQTVAALDRFLQHSKDPARLGEGYFLLGETYRGSGRTGDAELAYRECVKYPTRFQYHARYQLAVNSMARGELDDAESALELNLRLLRYDLDLKAQEKSLFALGNLLYRRRYYRMVVQRLDEALGKFPTNPEAVRAQYQLAVSYRRLASQQNQNLLIGERATLEWQQFFQAEHDEWLRKAAKAFIDLEERLRTDPGVQAVLSEEERAEIPFAAARCLFETGQYREALKVYDRLAEEYDKDHRYQPLRRVEALGGAVSCYEPLKDVPRARQRLMEIQLELPRLENKDRLAWQNWVTTISSYLRDPGATPD